MNTGLAVTGQPETENVMQEEERGSRTPQHLAEVVLFAVA